MNSFVSSEKLYNRLGDLFSSASICDVQSSLKPLLHAMRLLQCNENVDDMMAQCLFELGVSYHLLSNHNLAATHLQQAIDLFIKLGQLTSLTECLDYLARTEYELGHYDLAIKHYKCVIDHLTALQQNEISVTVAEMQTRRISNLYQRIGQIYEDQFQIDLAINYYYIGIKILMDLAIKLRKENVDMMIHIGDLLVFRGQPNLALQYYKLAFYKCII